MYQYVIKLYQALLARHNTETSAHMFGKCRRSVAESKREELPQSMLCAECSFGPHLCSEYHQVQLSTEVKGGEPGRDLGIHLCRARVFLGYLVPSLQSPIFLGHVIRCQLMTRGYLKAQ